MPALKLFCDASVDPHSGIGIAACLLIEVSQTEQQDVFAKIQLKRFEQTNPARLELQTLIWALQTQLSPGMAVTVHSDSQTLCQLPVRRQRLIATNFCSRQGRPLNNADLYREFYQLAASYQLQFCKQKGHLPGAERTANDLIFRQVDKAARAALRKELHQLQF